MTRRRPRTRRRARRRSRRALVLVLLVIAFQTVGLGGPGAALDVGRTDRPASIDVADDANGAARLNVTSELQAGTDGQCLVEITNRLGREVTVNVSLRDDSRQLGELQRQDDILGLQKGDSIEFPLADGATKTVNMNVAAGTAGNTTFFHVRATASGLTVELDDRSAPIAQTAGTTCA